ncbi:MAG: glycosyltransferase family 4 protein [Cyanobacteria bacterium P01_F01_bin.4]
MFDNLIKKGVSLSNYWPKTALIKQAFSNGRLDILHLHVVNEFFLGNNKLHRWIKFSIFVVQIIALRWVGVKTVWTVHEWADKYGGKWGAIEPFRARILGRLFDAIITHCDSTQHLVEKALEVDTPKLFTIVHGHYIGSYQNDISQADARARLNIPVENTTFLLFGNIYRSKGFLEAIDAFKQLPQIQASLIVVGFPAEPDIEGIIREKIAGYDNIRFEPRKIEDDEIQIYMNACDCAVVPYKVFTTSGVVILAMSFAKACIAPNMGYFSDVLDEHGAFLYEPNAEDGLICAMQSALSCQALTGMGAYNLQKVQRWDWDTVAEQTLDVYKTVLNVSVDP